MAADAADLVMPAITICPMNKIDCFLLLDHMAECVDDPGHDPTCEEMPVLCELAAATACIGSLEYMNKTDYSDKIHTEGCRDRFRDLPGIDRPEQVLEAARDVDQVRRCTNNFLFVISKKDVKASELEVQLIYSLKIITSKFI